MATPRKAKGKSKPKAAKRRAPRPALPALPRSVHLPAGAFRVELVRDLRYNEEKVHGLCNWTRREIIVEANLDRTSAWLTLCHEWVHAILYDAGVKLPKRSGYDDDPEEQVCNALAQALVAQMRGR